MIGDNVKFVIVYPDRWVEIPAVVVEVTTAIESEDTMDWSGARNLIPCRQTTEIRLVGSGKPAFEAGTYAPPKTEKRWICKHCLVENGESDGWCVKCGAPKGASVEAK